MDIVYEEVVIDSFGNEKTATRIAAYGYVGLPTLKPLRFLLKLSEKYQLKLSEIVKLFVLSSEIVR